MRRRTKDERREDYLDAGAQLVAGALDSGLRDPAYALAHVKLADVAAEAGVTKGALYHVWPSQEAFWADLLDHLLDSRRLAGADQVTGIIAAVAAGSGLELLRSYTTALFDVRKVDPSFYTRVALFSYLGDDAVRDRLDSDFRAGIAAATPLVERAVAELGRRPVDGLELEDFVIAVAALLDGLCLQYRISPERTPELRMGDDPDEALNLFSLGTEALLLSYTEPIEESA